MKFPGEIPPAFLQEILQLIKEKNEKWVFQFTRTVYGKKNIKNPVDRFPRNLVL